MDQVEAQLKKLRTKLDDVPAFQQAEVSWTPPSSDYAPFLGYEGRIVRGVAENSVRGWGGPSGVGLWSDSGISIEEPDQLPPNQSQQ